MDMGVGMIVVMVVMMTVMVGLVGAGMWAASRRSSRPTEEDSGPDERER